MTIEEDRNNYNTNYRNSGWNQQKQNAFSELVINALIEIRDKIPVNPINRQSIENPTSEDITKIHNEINQIVNQRFLISTAAITLFGVIGAWLVRENLEDPLVFFVSLLLSSLLFSLYIFSYFLKRTLRIFSTYLSVTDSSIWEKHWESYREFEKSQENKITWAYSKGHTIIFILLGIFSILFPFFIIGIRNKSFFQLEFMLISGLIIFVFINIVYLVIEWYIGFRSKWDNEEKLKVKWRNVLHIPQPTDRT